MQRFVFINPIRVMRFSKQMNDSVQLFEITIISDDVLFRNNVCCWSSRDASGERASTHACH